MLPQSPVLQPNNQLISQQFQKLESRTEQELHLVVPKRHIKIMDEKKVASASAKVKLQEDKKVERKEERVKKEDIDLGDLKAKEIASKEVCVNQELLSFKNNEKTIAIEKPPENRFKKVDEVVF